MSTSPEQLAAALVDFRRLLEPCVWPIHMSSALTR